MLLRIAGPIALLGWLIGSVIFGFLATTTTRWALLGLIANTLVWGLVICAFRFLCSSDQGMAPMIWAFNCSAPAIFGWPADAL